MSRKIAIIGGGIAGLAAGCYARMNGYEVEVLEAQAQPGGLCTSWQRGGYTIDGCIHWLVGSAPGTDFHTFWRELGVFPGTAIADPDDFGRYVGRDGRVFTLHTDADRLEAHLRQLSPIDAPLAGRLCAQVRRFARFNPPMDKAFETLGPLDLAAMMLRIGSFMKPLNALGAVSIGQWARRWNDPLLRAAWRQGLQDERYSLQALVMTLADLHRRAAGYPLGGSLALARAIERRLVSLGGRIRCKARVEKILVEAGRAAGVRLQGGEEIRAQVVISAADLRQTVDRLLEGRYREPQHEALFREVPVLPPAVLVCLGIRGALPGGSAVYELPSPISIGGVELEWLPVRDMSFDPSLAPAGCTLLQVLLRGDYGWWGRLADDRRAYRKEKQRALEAILRVLERFGLGVSERVEMSDVATPLSFERYSASRHGTFMTWIHNADTQKRFRVIRKTLPGLEGLYLCGMWLMAPGGLPSAVKTARDVIQLVCRVDRRRFTAAPA